MKKTIKPQTSPLPPVIEQTLVRPQPRLFHAITAEEFRKSDYYRETLKEAYEKILRTAFAAADDETERFTSISSPTDPMRDAMRNAERYGVAQYKLRLLSLCELRDTLAPVEPNYKTDYYEDLAKEPNAP